MAIGSSDQFDIFEIYRHFRDIKFVKILKRDEDFLKGDHTRESLDQLLKFVESRLHSRSLILEEVSKLMSRLEFMADFLEFSRVYEFVFFICRENGQKNISVSRAVSCWRLILAGRFRLLKQWCEFIEKHQRHNISEDTWKQVLAFSRCVHENLQGYDPEGAWPVLIDDFVEYMYRTSGYNRDRCCVVLEGQKLEDTFPGLKMCPGAKRKMENEMEIDELEPPDVSPNPGVIFPCKKKQFFAKKQFNWDSTIPGKESNDCQDITKYDNLSSPPKSQCFVESYLSKGFAELSTGHSLLQLDENKNLSDI